MSNTRGKYIRPRFNWARLIAHLIALIASIFIGIQGVTTLLDIICSVALALHAPTLVALVVAWSIAIVVGFGAGFFVNWLMNAALIPDLIEKRGLEGISKILGLFANPRFSLSNKIKYALAALALFVSALLNAAVAVVLGMQVASGVIMFTGGIFVALVYSAGEFETLFGYMDRETSTTNHEDQPQDYFDKHSVEINPTYAAIGKWCGRAFAIINAVSLGVLCTYSAYTLLALMLPHASASTLLLSAGCISICAVVNGGLFYWQRLSTIYTDISKASLLQEQEDYEYSGKNKFYTVSGANLAITLNAMANFSIHYFGAQQLLALFVSMSLIQLPAVSTVVIACGFGFAGGTASYLLGQTFWINAGKVAKQELTQQLGIKSWMDPQPTVLDLPATPVQLLAQRPLVEPQGSTPETASNGVGEGTSHSI